MRKTLTSAIMLCGLIMAANANAQSTISDSPFDLVASSGVWGAFLPDYELGTNGAGGPGIKDSLDNAGYYGDLKAIRRFLGTRTSFETRGFYGFTGSSKDGAPGTVDFSDPGSGNTITAAGGAASLKSRTHHYGFDIGLRDTWRTRFGGLSGGVYFSYMGFNQKFESSYGPVNVFDEKLESNYVGGKGFVGWDGCVCGNPSTFDFLVGFWDLDAQYTATGDLALSDYSTELKKTPISIEAIFSTYRDFRGYQIGTSVGFMHLTMPQIQHNDGAPTTLGSDRGTFIRWSLEFLL